MKRFILLLLSAALFFMPLSAGDFDDRGLISNWSFFPLQLDAGLVSSRKLVDENTNTFLAVGLLLLEQKSAFLSAALLANRLKNNYGIQLPPLILGSVTDNNYGISLGWENYCKNCYGIQMGIVNHSFAGEDIAKERERWQIFGINIADRVFLGLVNITDKLQIGLCNLSPGNSFQIGLINYNARSLIPWFPLINFDMKGSTPSSSRSAEQRSN